jgi:hypothetical protein
MGIKPESSLSGALLELARLYARLPTAVVPT